MKRHELTFFLIIMGTLIWAIGCKDDPEPNTNTTDNNDTDSEPNGTMPSNAGEVCGDAECDADLAAAKTALVNGNYAAAWAQYRCGDTVEAAAGAAITKMAIVAESQAVADLLADMGVKTPFSATDVIGKDGLLYQLGSYFDGSVEATVSNSVIPPIEINGHVYLNDYSDEGVSIGVPDNSIEADTDGSTISERLPTYEIRGSAESRDFDPSVQISIEPAIELSEGDTIQLEYNCAENYFEQSPLLADLYIDISNYSSPNYTYCEMSDWVSLSTCPTEIGAIEVVSLSGPGNTVEFRFTNVPLECYSEDGSTRTTESFSGTASAVLKESNDFNTEGMHPIFEDPEILFENVPATLTVNQMINHAVPLIDELEEAACYADKATNDSNGPVYMFPSALTGREAFPIMTRDTKALASAYYMAAALLRMAGSYDIPLRVGAMEEMTEEQLTTEINTNLGALKADHKMTEAGELVQQSVTSALAAIASKEAEGLLPSNDYTLAGEAVLKEYATFVQDSMAGLAPVPNTIPAIQVNLGSLFSNPIDPASINVDPVVYEGATAEYEGQMEGVEVFFQEAFSDVIPDFSYEMEDYEYGEEGEKLEEFGEEIFYAMCRYLGC